MPDGSVPRTQGRFITLEGGEGSGKSTLAKELGERIAATGLEVVLTREPGGSPGAEMVRHVLLSGAAEPLGPFAETLLFAAARSDHLETKIRPALARGAVVICDRFADSTRAYQGALGGVEPGLVSTIERVVVDRTMPDLTFVLDVPVTIARQRLMRRSEGPDRFEREAPDFHEKLRLAYLDIAAKAPGRFVVIDGTLAPAFVLAKALEAVSSRLGFSVT
jgi:dTMP kinase